MSENKYTDEQLKKIEAIKQEWMRETEIYLHMESDQEQHPHLDGPATWALQELQEKYMRKLREV